MPRNDRVWSPCGAKHSPPGHKLRKSKHPHASGRETPFLFSFLLSNRIQISKIKLYSNEAFSIRVLIFDVDTSGSESERWGSISVTFVAEILRNVLISTSWNQVLWNLVVWDIVPNYSWCLSKSPLCCGSFPMISNGFSMFHVKRVLRTPLSLCKRGCPRFQKSKHHLQWVSPDPRKSIFQKSNRIQMKHAWFWPSWFSTQIPTVFTSGSESDDWCGPNDYTFVKIMWNWKFLLLEIMFYKFS